MSQKYDANKELIRALLWAYLWLPLLNLAVQTIYFVILLGFSESQGNMIAQIYNFTLPSIGIVVTQIFTWQLGGLFLVSLFFRYLSFLLLTLCAPIIRFALFRKSIKNAYAALGLTLISLGLGAMIHTFLYAPLLDPKGGPMDVLVQIPEYATILFAFLATFSLMRFGPSSKGRVIKEDEAHAYTPRHQAPVAQPRVSPPIRLTFDDSFSDQRSNVGGESSSGTIISGSAHFGPKQTPESAPVPSLAQQDTVISSFSPQNKEVSFDPPQDTPAPSPAPQNTAVPFASPQDTPAPSPAPQSSAVPFTSPQDVPAPSPAPQSTAVPFALLEDAQTPFPAPQSSTVPFSLLEDAPINSSPTESAKGAGDPISPASPETLLEQDFSQHDASDPAVIPQQQKEESNADTAAMPLSPEESLPQPAENALPDDLAVLLKEFQRKDIPGNERRVTIATLEDILPAAKPQAEPEAPAVPEEQAAPPEAAPKEPPPAEDKCLLCGGVKMEMDSIALPDGSFIHRVCYDKILEKMSALKTDEETSAFFQASPHLMRVMFLANTAQLQSNKVEGTEKKRTPRSPKQAERPQEGSATKRPPKKKS